MIEKFNEERKKVTNEIREKLLGYLVAALGLVAGLAWNDAIKSTIEYAFPLNKDSLTMKFIYALIITLVIVVATVYLTRILKRKEEEKKNN